LKKLILAHLHEQGNVDKVVVVIKDNRDQTPLERFIFAVENMIELDEVDREARFPQMYHDQLDALSSDRPVWKTQ
jgi:hypothetical protein